MSKKLTNQEKEKVLQLYNDSLNITEISILLSRHYQTISRYMKSVELKVKNGRKKLPEVTERICKICRLNKNINDFNNHKNYPSGKSYICKNCSNKKRNDRRLRRVYGISQQEYDLLFEKQKGKCAICENPETTVDPRNHKIRKLSVDHSHNKESKIRELLCQKCNVTLGNVNDNITLLEKMISYLRKHNE